MRPPSWLLLIAVGLFVIFLLMRTWLPAHSFPRANRQARRRIGEAKRRATDPSSTPEARARAWQEAAATALDELKRPGLAASYALAAERANPTDPEALSAAVGVLRRADRLRALERFLWNRLAKSEGATYERAFVELLALYEGPLRRKQWAHALRKLRAERGGGLSSEALRSPATGSAGEPVEGT
jgi:hypothetical protein